MMDKAMNSQHLTTSPEETLSYNQLLQENKRLLLLTETLETERVRLESQIARIAEIEADRESLRWLVDFLQKEKKRTFEQLQKEKVAVHQLERERAELQNDLKGIAEHSREFTDRYVLVEQQNTRLANLYVACCRLHSTLELNGVIEAVREIVINLVGTEELALFELDQSGSTLSLIGSFGIDEQQFREIRVGEGPIGGAAAMGRLFIRRGEEPDGPLVNGLPLSACVPLKVDGRVTGAIAVFRLLQQKGNFGPADIELFDLLATHAASALYCASLHGRRRLEAAS